jgi:protein-S-isoprenylcysteine O-methyltransferase Ste14
MIARSSMTIFDWLICASWLILVGYWCVSGVAAVRSIGRRWIWWREIVLRLGFFALVLLGLQIEAAAHVVPNAGLYILNKSTLMGISGLVLSATGVGLAIAARACLGLGWVVPVSSKEQRELITTGPYALVRHPMYGGLLLAMLGSAIGQSIFWLLPLIVYGPGFILSARREENLLIEQFSGRYRDYMGRTKMFVPFVI